MSNLFQARAKEVAYKLFKQLVAERGRLIHLMNYRP